MNVVIVGRRRQGKSTLSMFLAARKRTVIIFDPNANFTCGFIAWDLQLFQHWLYSEKPHGVCIFRPSPERIWEDFSAFSEMLWPMCDYALVIDEASCLQSSHRIHPFLERLIRQAPREEPNAVWLIQSAHRMVDYHGISRSLSSDTILFQTTHARDLDLIEDQFGSEVSEKVQRLGRFICLHHWGNESGQEVYRVWEDPQVWFVPLKGVEANDTVPSQLSSERVGAGNAGRPAASTGPVIGVAPCN